ncbi:MAG: aconitase family protein, partial [Anaerolineaceae bacterium]|nr:aconitase family protein [Anaerolineaceae bacterium]
MGASFSQKVLARNVGRAQVRPGEVLDVTPDVVLSHDNSAAIIRIFRQLPQKELRFPERLAITLDHAVPPPTPQHAQNHAEIRRFVAEQGIQHFFEMGRGICHQVHCEEGVVGPGMILLGADSHSPHCGWMGAFGAGVGRTEVAALWATGQLWLRVPETLRITLTGRLAPGVMSKDLALQLIGRLGADGANYLAVEFDGPGVATLSADMRAALVNMMAEMGAKNAFIAPDDKTWRWLETQLQRSRPNDWQERLSMFRERAILPDADANCAQQLDMALDDVVPMVSCPHRVDNTEPVTALTGTRVDLA